MRPNLPESPELALFNTLGIMCQAKHEIDSNCNDVIYQHCSQWCEHRKSGIIASTSYQPFIMARVLKRDLTSNIWYAAQQ